MELLFLTIFLVGFEKLIAKAPADSIELNELCVYHHLYNMTIHLKTHPIHFAITWIITQIKALLIRRIIIKYCLSEENSKINSWFSDMVLKEEEWTLTYKYTQTCKPVYINTHGSREKSEVAGSFLFSQELFSFF